VPDIFDRGTPAARSQTPAPPPANSATPPLLFAADNISGVNIDSSLTGGGPAYAAKTRFFFYLRGAALTST
jgi:hypothetical protein